MAFCELKFFSKGLQKATAANILLPEGKGDGPFPVFYLLHGLSDDHTIWLRRSSIERYVQDLPLIVVMPDGGRNFYTDLLPSPEPPNEDSRRWGVRGYETALMQDLISYVDAMFPTKATRAGRCIGGLSMGGYGAMKLALKYPEMFCSAVSHSGALCWAQSIQENPPGFKEWLPLFGETPVGGQEDLFALAAKLTPAQRPALRIDCGVDDFLIESNRTFHQHLDKIGYAHEYEEFPGDHNWAYWDEHVQEAIAFHLRHLEE